jgi:two-component system sensor histidine kinase and response regulator WspE
MSKRDLSELSMFELFRMEAESQSELLVNGLLALERNRQAPEVLDSCMRAAHSLKGAARIVGLEAAVSVTHAMEDCFVGAQQGRRLAKRHIDALLRGVDLIARIAAEGESKPDLWCAGSSPEVEAWTAALRACDAAPPTRRPSEADAEARAGEWSDEVTLAATDAQPHADRYLRVTAHNFDRLLGLSSQALIESRWLEPFYGSLLHLKQQQRESLKALDTLRDALQEPADLRLHAALSTAHSKALACEQGLSARIVEFEQFERRQGSVARRLHDETLSCRMRPFADGVQAFPRMVRDLAQSLGKRARLSVLGEDTQVDRDVLEKLEAPLMHLLRNALDHGLDTSERRAAQGKPPEGSIKLQARHAAGLLQISVTDDGEGIDKERVRSAIVRLGLLAREAAERLSEAELYDFLFLPGFTIKEDVTEISGRGVGLDAVQDSVRKLRGSIQVTSQAGQGATFQLLLPLTLSLMRTLVVEIGGEPYALPLACIERTLHVPRSAIQVLEGRQHVADGGRQIGLVAAHQLFGCEAAKLAADPLPVVVLSHHDSCYGLVVDRFLGVRELVVQPLDARLGKVKDIAAGAVLDDGSPTLVVDVMDLLLSIERLSAVGDLAKVGHGSLAGPSTRRKRVLVVDDSLTVRELERKLLDNGGYEVDVAVDGLDAWNSIRTGDFNLIVTDIDMPRLDGIELTRLIRQDVRLRTIPVMIVSYKDREEDRRRGLDAGADFYLAKSSFHSDNLLQAVVDLIGEP